MALSFAGVDLIVPTPTISDWVFDHVTLADVLSDSRLYFPTNFTTGFKWPDFVKHPVQLNRLFWPAGASRWATGCFLATDEQLARIRSTAVPATGGIASSTLKMTWVDQKGNEVAKIEPGMYMLPAWPLSQISGLPSPLRNLYLLPLVDLRFLLWQVSTGSLTVTDQSTTWATLFANLATALGITLTVDTVASGYANVPGQFGVTHEYASVILDGAAYSVGQRVVRGLDGTWRSMSATNSSALVTSNAALTTARSVDSGGTFASGDVNAALPANVTVYFPQTATTGTTKTGAVSTTGHSKAWLYHHSMKYTGSNDTALQTLATQLGTDLKSWLSPQRSQCWVGIVPLTPEGQHDIEWTYRLGEVSTRITPSPYTDFMLPIAAGGSDIGCRLYDSGAGQSVSAAATTAITFDSENYDTDTMHSTSSNTSRITITTAGKYTIWFGLRSDLGVGPPSAGSYQRAILYKNGAATDHLDVRDQANAVGSGTSYYAQLSLMIEDNYSAADYLEVFVHNADAASTTVKKAFFGARKVDKGG